MFRVLVRVVFLLLVCCGSSPLAASQTPQPVTDAYGVIHLSLSLNDAVFDSTRNLVWASTATNTIVSIDVATGLVIDQIPVAGDPGPLALSSDSSRLFAAHKWGTAVSVIDLNARQLLQTFPLSSAYPSRPLAVTAVPNAAGSVIVIQRILDFTIPRGLEIVIYDNGTPRPGIFSSIEQPPDEFGRKPNVTELYPADAPNSFYGVDAEAQYGNGTHDLWRVRLDSAGISLEQRLTPLPIDPGDPGLVLDGAGLITSDGGLWTPDTTRLLGRFGEGGLPVPLPELGRIAFIRTDKIIVFDVNSMVPVSTLPFVGFGGAGLVAFRTGPDRIAVSRGNEFLLIPLAVLQPWQNYSVSLELVRTGVRRMDLPVAAIAAVPDRAKLLLATPGRAGVHGNRLITFDPATNAVESTVFAGSEPAMIAPTPDGSAAYVSLSGEQRMARVDLNLKTRDLVFTLDPNGGSKQYEIYDMTMGADGGLAIAYYGGGVAVFDGDNVRPVWDKNLEGAYAYGPGGPSTLRLAFNTAGKILYGFNTYLSTAEFKRFQIAPDGVHWLSSADGLLGGDTHLIYSEGLIFASNGNVIDPERSRVVRRFSTQLSFDRVLPDPSARRIYAAYQTELAVYDMDTYVKLAALQLPVKSFSYSRIRDLVQLNAGSLALQTNDDQVFVVDISAIPLLAVPVQPPPPRTLPQTPGVTVVDLASHELAYNPVNGILYASTPNREAAFGDRIAEVNPVTGSIGAMYPAGSEPRKLAVSGDGRVVYYSSGFINNQLFSGFSFNSESVRTLDLASGAIGPVLAARPPTEDMSFGIVDLTTLPWHAQSVVVIDNLYQGVPESDGSFSFVNRGPYSIRVVDGDSVRPNALLQPAFNCTVLIPGPDPSTLYCATTSSFSKLRIDANGVTVFASLTLPSSSGLLTDIVSSGGRIYTNTGLVIDPAAMSLVAQLDTHGPVAVDGGRVFWMEPVPSMLGQSTMTLRSFDPISLAPVDVRVINVTSADSPRFVACGPGCLAFAAGREIYIVNLGTAFGLGSRGFLAAPGGGVSWTTAGNPEASLVVSHAVVRDSTNTGSTALSPLGGFAIVGLRQNGILVSEATVPGRPLIRSGRIFVEVDSRNNTGVAFANPNAEPAMISFYFTDSTGNSIRHGNVLIPTMGQISRFLSQSPFNGALPLNGTFTFSFTSSIPISFVAIRTFVNERSEFLMTTSQLTDLDAAPRTDPVLFPHFADGGGWFTRIILVNPTDTTLTGTLRYRNPQGADLFTPANYSILPRSNQVFRTEGTAASIVSGSVIVSPAAGGPSPSGMAVFSLRQAGVTVTEVGVPASTSASAFRVYAEAEETVRTAVAIANASQNAATVQVELLTMEGTPRGVSGTLSIPGNGQIARFLHEIAGFTSLPMPLRGILRISSTTPISILALRARYNERGEFLATATPPVQEGAVSPNSILYFPHVVNSGGYTTQFILMNSGPGTTTSGTVHFFSTSGQPMEVPTQ